MAGEQGHAADPPPAGTLIFQSCRPNATPDWILCCTESVRRWAADRGHAYRLLDDAFLDVVPGWFADRCAGERLPVTDLARLLWARRFLDAGWARVVWLDADVLIIRPHAFAPERAVPHAVGREYWLRRDDRGALVGAWAATNCVLVFTPESALLDFYIETAEAIVRRAESVHRLALGPALLTPLGRVVPLPLVMDLATCSPLLTAEIAAGSGGAVLAAHAAAWRAPVNAVHLCGSTGDAPGGLGLIDAGTIDRAAARLAADPALIG